jgi:hypothetical protein
MDVLKVFKSYLPMSKTSTYSFHYLRTFILTVGVCLIANLDLKAQGEREKNIQELSKENDPGTQYENESSVFDTKADSYYLPYSQSSRDSKSSGSGNPNVKDQQLYKQGGEKDLKKEGMSTLSFNLFLYIVDKFKED